MIHSGFFHQMPGRRPIAMAIEQSANDPAAQHSLECLILGKWLPFSNNLFAGRKTANMQTFRICRPTTEASEIRSVRFLDAFFCHIGLQHGYWRLPFFVFLFLLFCLFFFFFLSQSG